MRVEFKQKLVIKWNLYVVVLYCLDKISKFMSLRKNKNLTENNEKYLIQKNLSTNLNYKVKISVLDFKIRKKNLKQHFFKVLYFCLLGENNYTK